MGRTIRTQKGKTRWYDLPLTEEEIEQGRSIGEPGEYLTELDIFLFNFRLHVPLRWRFRWPVLGTS